MPNVNVKGAVSALQPYIKIVASGIAAWVATTKLGLHIASSQVSQALVFVLTYALTHASLLAHAVVAKLPTRFKSDVVTLEHTAEPVWGQVKAADPGIVAQVENLGKTDLDRLATLLHVPAPFPPGDDTIKVAPAQSGAVWINPIQTTWGTGATVTGTTTGNGPAAPAPEVPAPTPAPESAPEGAPVAAAVAAPAAAPTPASEAVL